MSYSVMIDLSAMTHHYPVIYYALLKKVSEYDQEIPQSHTADQPMAP